MTTQTIDPWTLANDVTEESIQQNFATSYYGQVEMDVWTAALIKGQGKVPYDPVMHKDKRPTAAINLTINLLPEHGQIHEYIWHREMVEFEREWYQFTKPSALECEGHVDHIRNLPGKWVKYDLVPTGETYQKLNASTGQNETRNKTAIKFLKIYPSEDACRFDYMTSDNGSAPQPAAQQQPLPQNGNGNGNGNGNKAAMLPFLKVIVQNACRGQQDLQVIRDTVSVNIAQYPMVADVFTVDSPETAELIMQELAK